ncbi:hypothetical protein AJ80_04562 [Polytolypa hystricis UAMH7299]|uniref:DUF202 domain-containing protein n=1 Tax=Polytolypa hystricis (strain UAMH7299) TaxID=1447883 RepID=A0A2B7YA92_POLH7|nr:hypothetical protein AJ80_04562 [Polytolypa hystricis UAMH7299]
MAEADTPADGHIPSSSSSSTQRDVDIQVSTPHLQEATELADLTPVSRRSSVSSISSGDVRMVTRLSTRSSQRTTQDQTGALWAVRKYWTRNVVLTVPQAQNRDHFALERTYLAYIRTSLSFAFLGVLIAQLFSLQEAPSQKPGPFGFYEVGLPLACVCYGVAIVMAFVGAIRFWRQQNALARGKVYVGGWELGAAAIFTFAYTVTSSAFSNNSSAHLMNQTIQVSGELRVPVNALTKALGQRRSEAPSLPVRRLATLTACGAANADPP